MIFSSATKTSTWRRWVYEQIIALSGGVVESLPVGAVYTSSSSSNPNVALGYGTWTQIQDVMLMAAGSTYGAGTTGGSANAIAVSHTHTASSAVGGIHNHSGSALSAGNHRHYTTGVHQTSPNTYDTQSTSGADGTWGTTYSSYAGTHTHTLSINNSASHSHTITVNSAGSSGTGANLPPYKAFYMWERTA